MVSRCLNYNPLNRYQFVPSQTSTFNTQIIYTQYEVYHIHYTRPLRCNVIQLNQKLNTSVKQKSFIDDMLQAVVMYGTYDRSEFMS